MPHERDRLRRRSDTPRDREAGECKMPEQSFRGAVSDLPYLHRRKDSIHLRRTPSRDSADRAECCSMSAELWVLVHGRKWYLDSIELDRDGHPTASRLRNEFGPDVIQN